MRSACITTGEARPLTTTWGMPTQQWRPSSAQKKERNTTLKMVRKSKQWCQDISLHWIQCTQQNCDAHFHLFQACFILEITWLSKKILKASKQTKIFSSFSSGSKMNKLTLRKKFQNVKKKEKKNCEWTNTLKYCRVTEWWWWGQLGRINKQENTSMWHQRWVKLSCYRV